MPVGSITIMHGSNNTVRRLMHSFKGMGPVLCSVTIRQYIYYTVIKDDARVCNYLECEGNNVHGNL